jgi:uncharacterized SAM-binding protein YcdF (DUF218 family)
MIRGTAALAAVVLLVFQLHVPILTGLGRFLVKAGPPEKADIIVVLAGDGFGHRVLKAGELVKQGYAPKVLVDGPDGDYGLYECDLAIPFAVKAGYPESYFIHFEITSHSTEQEAHMVAERLRCMGVKRVIVVTSDFHTRRSGKIFHRVAPDLEVFMVAAPDENFAPESWWRNREARKTFLLEWTKTIAEW